MRYLILSDIHANWEALQAVLEDAAGAYDRIVCCGDLVGYGADPNAVAEWSRSSAGVVVRGNHDRACTGIEDLEWFNPAAKSAALWTQTELTPENADYVRGLEKGPATVADFQLVHGSPLDEDEYVVTIGEARNAFFYVEASPVFFGHTHLQGGFIWRRSRVERIGRPELSQARMLLELDPDCAYLVNPGSVGQPRDGDPRAAYILYDPEDKFLFYRRVRYDTRAAQRKIVKAGLPHILADRLSIGK